VPGLIDIHVHLDSHPSYGGYTGPQFSDRFWSVLQVKHAGETLDAGFTTVRNVGSDAFNDVGLRQAIDEGKIRGPRVVTAAYSFDATGGVFSRNTDPTRDVRLLEAIPVVIQGGDVVKDAR
jgi:imidazolonepropionase-like amidohydrolase